MVNPGNVSCNGWPWRHLERGPTSIQMAEIASRPMAQTRRAKPQMSDAQKKAMAEGRTTSRSVAKYLEALAATAPRRGRRRTRDSIERRLRVIEEQLPSASPITK